MFEDLRLDWRSVRKGVESFNTKASAYSLAAYFRVENSMRDLFSQPLSAENVPLQVMAINSLWRTNLQMQSEGVVRTSEFIVSRLKKISRSVTRIAAYELPVADGDLGAVTSMAQRVLGLCLDSNLSKKPFVFATKFLHLCRPAALPIYDNRSETSMNRLLKQSGLKSAFWEPGGNLDDCKRMYKKLIVFYNTALASLNGQQRSDLATLDYETQPQGLRRKNSLVRILDKYLYQTGN